MGYLDGQKSVAFLPIVAYSIFMTQDWKLQWHLMARIRPATAQVHWTFMLIVLVLGGGCASPAGRFDRLARERGLQRQVVPGEGFEHVVYARDDDGGDVLHVYLAGDGTPWLTRHRPALDPTPRRPVMLDLMALDPAPSMLLGRPCYHGLSRVPGCSVWDWTAGRYSERVVISSVEALAHWVRRRPVESLVVIGYSGGGTLAMLLTEFWEVRRRAEDLHLPPIRQVVTIAANLDIDRWSELHGYSPLSGSLNPARRPALPENIRQWHLMGVRDSNVPPELVEQVVESQIAAERLVFAEFDHSCCWESIWGDFLKRLD